MRSTPPPRVLDLFVDDSGNTGPDLLTREQPLGVTAMVLVTAKQKQRIADLVARVVDEGRHLLPKEFKFARLARTAPGRRALESAFRAVRESGARVFFSITEKRYLAAAMVVETFLDPHVTRGVPLAMLNPVERRRATNLVYQGCDDDILVAFVAAAHASDRRALAKLGGRVAGRINVLPADEAPVVAEAVRSALADPFVWDRPPDAPQRIERLAPHTFTFIPLLSAVDAYLREAGAEARVVADEDALFGEVLGEALQAARRADLFPGGVGRYGVRGPIAHILDRVEAPSHNELGIQMADLAAGIVAAAARGDFGGQSIGDLADAWTLLRTCLLDSAPSSFWEVSERGLASLTRSFGELVPPRDPWWWARV